MLMTDEESKRVREIENKKRVKINKNSFHKITDD